jgi:glycosyltransferase involved in cell wall biosynthesis
MKIGLIGNMNNNNFALMRYFRDLGADAHLLLYANDGTGSLSHFKPESDTWEIEKWLPFIHKTSIPNAPVAALDFPYSWLIWFWSIIRSWLGQGVAPTKAVSRKQIRDVYAQYSRLLASGISPATLRRAGISLDVFYPYSTGVEFFRTGEFLVRFGQKYGFNRFIFTRVAQRQMEGVRAAKSVLNAEMGITQDVLLDIGVVPQNLVIPMVYGQGQSPETPSTKVCQSAWDAIVNSEFTLLHQSRLMWSNPGHYSKDEWIRENKNNDWLLHAFAELMKSRPALKACLLIVEYGPDVATTKRLAAELEIDKYIHWLPKMDRRELMWILARVSVGVGEFYDLPKILWGGTGWEALASGKPLLQGFNFEEGEFAQIYGYPPPPMLPVRNQEDILRHLLDMADYPEKREEIGRGAKEWFNRYNGIGLAKQWLEILMVPREDDGDTKKVTVNQGVHG